MQTMSIQGSKQNKNRFYLLKQVRTIKINENTNDLIPLKIRLRFIE